MGIMKLWMDGTLARGGSHSVDTSAILQPMGQTGINPLSSINWATSSPTVKTKVPGKVSVSQADKAEREAALMEISVNSAKRVLKAEARKQNANAELITAHRSYLGKTASSHLKAAKANVGLASRLNEVRKDYAQLGMGLERNIDRTNQTIDVIAAKYDAIKR
jgi:hypothetical protein